MELQIPKMKKMISTNQMSIPEDKFSDDLVTPYFRRSLSMAYNSMFQNKDTIFTEID